MRRIRHYYYYKCIFSTLLILCLAPMKTLDLEAHNGFCELEDCSFHYFLNICFLINQISQIFVFFSEIFQIHFLIPSFVTCYCSVNPLKIYHCIANGRTCELLKWPICTQLKAVVRKVNVRSGEVTGVCDRMFWPTVSDMSYHLFYIL